MPNAWDVTDEQLERELESIIDGESADATWHVRTFKNDYVPAPGSSELDYTESDYPGYEEAALDPTLWGAVSVVSHVAISVHDTLMQFEADASGFVSQPVYGYYVMDGDDNYVWGERFAELRTIHPSDILRVTVERRHGVAPS